jgi:hypothetical protein
VGAEFHRTDLDVGGAKRFPGAFTVAYPTAGSSAGFELISGSRDRNRG